MATKPGTFQAQKQQKWLLKKSFLHPLRTWELFLMREMQTHSDRTGKAVFQHSLWMSGSFLKNLGPFEREKTSLEKTVLLDTCRRFRKQQASWASFLDNIWITIFKNWKYSNNLMNTKENTKKISMPAFC